MLLVCVAEFIHSVLCISLVLGGKEGASGHVRLKDDSRSPGACRDRTLTAGPPHGLYPFCRGANQQPGLLLPHPSEVRRRQKLLRVHWPVVFPQGNC